MTFELVDYRVFAKQHPGEFDRIISCEMIEAVGHNYLPSYFAAVERLLAPDGVFVMEVRVHTEPVH
jgi:cyclopropane-fatty-acyl-phospholipid synthase